MDTELVGPCSIRQSMYMFPEEYAITVDGKRYREQIDVTLFGGGLIRASK